MPNLQVITFDAFKSKSWKPVPNYGLFSKNVICPLSAQELAHALLDMPIAFIKTDDRFSIVAVLGLLQDRNLFVDEAGNWLGRYVPAHYRSYPFVLALNSSAEDQLVFCIDEDSGLISETDENEPFFDSDESLSTRLKAILELLEALHNNHLVTNLICSKLFEKGLLQPWQLEIKSGSDSQQIEGLFTVNETALNALAPDDFLELRELGALPVAYCQLLSVQNVDRLAARI